MNALHAASFLLLILCPLLPAQSLTRGPSVWETNDSSFLVAFKSSSSATGHVEWGPTEALGNTTSGTSTSTHAIRITGLQPDRFYWYRVRLNGNPVTPICRTRTFPADGADLTFFVFGDCGTGGSAQTRVANLYKEWNWDLGVMPGDIIYPDGQASGFNPYFFTPYASVLTSTPHYPTLGNHDVHTSNGGPYLDAFYLPTANSGTERWYSFDFGKCHFIGLDSTQASSSTQRTWLRNDLIAARAAGAMWIFVTFHHPGYSSGDSHGRDQTVYQNWCPLFEEFEVDAVFQGHDHIYERTTVRRDFFPNNRGVVYYVVGGGGASLYSISPEPYSAYSRSTNGVLKVDVRGQVFRSVYLDASSSSFGTQRDPYMTPALRATSPDAQPSETFTGAFDAPTGSFIALFGSVVSGYTNVAGLGLLHLGTDVLLKNATIGSSQSDAFSLAIPNLSVLAGQEIYFQGVTVSGAGMNLQLTDVLYSQVR
jgi:hypothetical protein